MSRGLQATFDLLSSTENEAAVAVLVAALDSPVPAIQEGALRAIFERRSPVGQREALRRLHRAGPRWREILDARRGRMSTALRDAVLSADPQMCANGCQAIVWFREYDLAPALINAAEDESNPNRQRAAQTIVELARMLYEELGQPRDYRVRRDPQTVRRHIVGALEASLARYPKHRRLEIVEAFLILVFRDNATLRQVLHDPHHAVYQASVELLGTSQQGGVVRLLLSLLEDPHAPQAALAALSQRSDPKFIENLLRQLTPEPSKIMAANLHRVEHFAWLQSDQNVIDSLDGLEQHAVVQLVKCSGMPRRETFALLRRLLETGRPEGRRAAARALENFSGSEANTLVLRALDDPDPLVQAGAAVQLRARGIQGALARLIELLDSPHPEVVEAARASLSEFSARRFLASFDMLEESTRESTGLLVRKIDLQTIPLIRQELAAQARGRRIKALRMAMAMDVVPAVEDEVALLLGDEDHIVRAEAAAALGTCGDETAVYALREALGDRSPIVQEAAAQSLQQVERATGTRPAEARNAAGGFAGEAADE